MRSVHEALFVLEVGFDGVEQVGQHGLQLYQVDTGIQALFDFLPETKQLAVFRIDLTEIDRMSTAPCEVAHAGIISEFQTCDYLLAA
jgi:hypothetical protein